LFNVNATAGYTLQRNYTYQVSRADSSTSTYDQSYGARDNIDMAATAEKVTYAEFRSNYERGDRSFEYWKGEAIPKGMPTWIHGLLQAIVVQLLGEAGYVAASEVELRIVEDAHPKPDVIATSGAIEQPYPTEAVDVVVEILSEDDTMPYVLEKCEAYDAWGFKFIYIINPERRQLFRWTGLGLEISSELTSIPAKRIWEHLDQALRKKP
jgi:Uma2 family endonuclease